MGMAPVGQSRSHRAHREQELSTERRTKPVRERRFRNAPNGQRLRHQNRRSITSRIRIPAKTAAVSVRNPYAGGFSTASNANDSCPGTSLTARTTPVPTQAAAGMRTSSRVREKRTTGSKRTNVVVPNAAATIEKARETNFHRARVPFSRVASFEGRTPQRCAASRNVPSGHNQPQKKRPIRSVALARSSPRRTSTHENSRETRLTIEMRGSYSSQ